MVRKSKDRPGKSNCPLTMSKRKRVAADKMTASIKDGYPTGLAQPALRALAAAGFARLEELRNVQEADS
jgi:hypothetical protein